MKPPNRRAGNRPGLSQIAYRMGDYASVRQRLLEQLPETVKVLSHEPSAVSLAKLTTRAEDDFAIALIDAWAVVTDVLTFYQERIANEGYMLTATERRSVLELARSIGYELDPGVAATTHLSFTVEEAPDAPTEANVPMGTQVMSVPLKDELPQTFETVEDLIAHVEWNAIKLRASRAPVVDEHTRSLHLTGTNTQLTKGSLLLLVDADNPAIAHVLILTEVQEESDELTKTEQTQVHWKTALPPITEKLLSPKVFTFEQVAHLFGSNAPEWEIMPEAVKLAALEKSGEAIRGGIFGTKDNGQSWRAASQGLPNSDILCLVARDQMLFAGTPDKGLFRSVDNGLTWEAANEGLTSQNVLALHMADKESIFNEALFAGTPNGGVFRSRDKGKNWVAINTGTLKTKQIGGDEWKPVNTSLPNTVVRSLLTCQIKNDGLGPVSSDKTTVTATEDNEFYKTPQVGDRVFYLDQSREVTEVPNNNSFKIDQPFITKGLPAGTKFSATVTLNLTFAEAETSDAANETAIDEAVDTDTSDTNAENESTEDRTTDIETDPPPTTKTITNGNITSDGLIVTGRGTDFRELSEFATDVSRREDVATAEIASIKITAMGQTVDVKKDANGEFQISSETRLVTTTSFTREELDAGTNLSIARRENFVIFVGTDEGVYYSDDQGKNWKPSDVDQPNAVPKITVYALAFIPDSDGTAPNSTVAESIIAGTEKGIWVSVNGGKSWLEDWNQGAVQDKKVLSLTHTDDFLFAGTTEGIYRRNLRTNEWRAINIPQNNVSQPELASTSSSQQAISDLATYERGDTHYLFATTSSGIFVSENGQDDQVVWQNVSEQMTTQKATALALDPSSKTLFSGTQFDGFSKPAETKSPVETTAESIDESPASEQPAPPQPEWPSFALSLARELDLETLYPQILPESWVVLFTDRHAQNTAQAIDPVVSAHQVTDITALDRSDFGLSGKITRAKLDTDITIPNRFGLRSTSVFIQSTFLEIAPEPLSVLKQQANIFTDPIAAPGTLFLNELIPYLHTGQTVIVSGQPMRGQLTDVGGVLRSQYQWKNFDHNLRNTVINTLSTAKNTLQFVGTDEGLYRWKAGTDSWEAIIALNYKVIHSLWQGGEDHGTLIVGADQQVYRSVNAGATWKILTDIQDTILQTVVDYAVTSQAIAPAITAISGTTLTLTSTPEPQIKPGAVVTISDQHRVVTEVNETKNTITVQAVFEPSLDGEYGPSAAISSSSQDIQLLFAGTHRGLYRSLDKGAYWQLLTGLAPDKITAMCAIAHGPTTKKISSFIVATQQVLQRSDDNGESWSPIAGSPKNILQLLPIITQSNQSLLWVGTTQGLYLYTFSGAESSWAAAPDLPNRQILSLAQRPGQLDTIIIAGTDQGIYRCSYKEQSPIQRWESIDAGLGPATGRTLAALTNQLIVGTEQGIFVGPSGGKREDPIRWGRNNTGLDNTQVRSLAASSSGTEIMAGTTAGTFLSTSAGRHWQPLFEGLTLPGEPTPLAITALLATTTNTLTTRWYAGTQAGLFSWQPGETRWTFLQSGLAYTDVLALAELSEELPAQLPAQAQRQKRLLVGMRSGGLLQYDPNRPIQQQWTPTSLNNTDVQSIVEQNRRIFAGTLRDGLYRSADNGTTWENITQTRAGKGSLTSEDIQVSWSPTASSGAFEKLLMVGDTINVQGQSRRLVSTPTPIENNHQWSFRIDAPFNPDLETNSSFTIDTGLSNRNITALEIAPQRDDVPLTLYAGTAGSGVFRSTDGGDRWQQIITNLDDLEIRCLMVEADQKQTTLWAGTAQKGVFRSINQGDLWAPINHHLTNTDIQVILRPTHHTSLMVGGIGILISDDQLTTTPIQKNDIFQVITPPIYSQESAPQESAPSDAKGETLAEKHFEYQTWTLKDPLKQLQGTLRTPKQHPFPLLPADPDTDAMSEVAIIQVPPTDQKQPIMRLQSALRHSYDPATVSIHANIAKASHGETVEQVLGSGDGNETYQQFALNKPPLTYTPAANATGSQSTLSLRVDGVLWTEAASIYPLTHQDKSYIIRIEDDNTTRVSFGNGRHGARLPSGEENITATYRSGLGLEGNLNPGQLNILKTRPQGITDVINPLAATGAANRERLEDARVKAPPTVRTLDRIVSLQDFEDFAQGFVGIGKAQAAAMWNGATQLVHITLAGIEGAAVPPTSQLYQQLQQAIDQARDPMQQVLINSYDRQLFNVEARVLVDPRYIAEEILAAIGTKLKQIFTFNKQQFDLGVSAAEVIAAIQSVEGVSAVDLDALYRVGESRELASELTVHPARYVVDESTRASTLAPAQLLFLNPLGIQLSLVSAL